MLKTCSKKGALGLTELQTTVLKLRAGMRGMNPSTAQPCLLKQPRHRFRTQVWGPVLKPQNKQDTLSILLDDLEDIKLRTKV